MKHYSIRSIYIRYFNDNGYGVIAVPTGIVVELARKKEDINTRNCSECSSEGTHAMRCIASIVEQSFNFSTLLS